MASRFLASVRRARCKPHHEEDNQTTRQHRHRPDHRAGARPGRRAGHRGLRDQGADPVRDQDAEGRRRAGRSRSPQEPRLGPERTAGRQGRGSQARACRHRPRQPPSPASRPPPPVAPATVPPTTTAPPVPVVVAPTTKPPRTAPVPAEANALPPSNDPLGDLARALFGWRFGRQHDHGLRRTDAAAPTARAALPLRRPRPRAPIRSCTSCRPAPSAPPTTPRPSAPSCR
jgi:hypothetical protein